MTLTKSRLQVCLSSAEGQTNSVAFERVTDIAYTVAYTVVMLYAFGKHKTIL